MLRYAPDQNRKRETNMVAINHLSLIVTTHVRWGLPLPCQLVGAHQVLDPFDSSGPFQIQLLYRSSNPGRNRSRALKLLLQIAIESRFVKKKLCTYEACRQSSNLVIGGFRQYDN